MMKQTIWLAGMGMLFIVLAACSADENKIAPTPEPLRTVSLATAIPATRTAIADTAPVSFDWQLPVGYPAPVVPPDNPMTQQKFELGR